MFSFVSFFLSFCSQCGKFLESSRTHELTKSEESRVDEEEMKNKLKKIIVLSDFITGILPLLKSKLICEVDHFPNSVENFYWDFWSPDTVKV